MRKMSSVISKVASIFQNSLNYFPYSDASVQFWKNIALWSRSIQNSNGRLCVVTQWGKGLTEPVGYGLINMHFSLQRSEDKRGAGEITDCFTVCSWARTLQPPPFMSTSTCYCKNLGQKVVCKLCVSDTESHRVNATVVTALSQSSILFFPAVP